MNNESFEKWYVGQDGYLTVIGKEHRTTCQISFEAGQRNASPMGVLSFEEWYDREGHYKMRGWKDDMKEGWEAGQRNISPPGRWVKCSERRPCVPLHELPSEYKARDPHNPSTCIAWWEWTFKIPPHPPSKDKDEDAIHYTWYYALTHRDKKGPDV